MNERETLLKRVQVCDFVLNDVAMYLNNNPDDEMALKHYKKYQEMREHAVAEYVGMYGPISRSDYDGGSRWKWVDNPWPWQSQEV